MKISAVIFDLDGTILDNEDEYGKAFGEVLKKLGKKPDSAYPHTQGIGVEGNWEILIPKYKIKTKKTIDELAKETQNEYLKLLPEVTLKEGIGEFISDLKDSGILVALATSNTWPTVDKVFKEFGLEGIFSVVTTGEEVTFRKPDSEIFLLTIQKLGVDLKECLVIEDTPAGVEAAHTAGMKVVAIARDKKHAEELKKADLIIFNFLEMSAQKMLELKN